MAKGGWPLDAGGLSDADSDPPAMLLLFIDFLQG
jgi:hypothetical protein